jgi:hypothetical protein
MSTLAQLVSSVRRALSDYNERASASDEGKDGQTVFRLPDGNIIGPEVIMAETALGEETTTVTDLVDPPYVAVVAVQGTAAGMAGDVAVTGTDWQGLTVTDTIALSGTSAVNGTQKFKTVVSVTLPPYTNDETDHVSITSAHSLACSVDAVATTAFIMDFDTGWFQFDTAPGTGEEIVWNYTYTYWSKADIVDAINYGIESLFPFFYIRDLDTSLSTVSSTYEYTLPECAAVAGVEWRASSGPYMRLKPYRYTVRGDGTLQFHDNPSSGSLRLDLIKRPGTLVYDTDSLSDLGLPERARHPILLAACYWLLSEKFAQRLNSDVAVVTQDSGNVAPEQQRPGIAHFKFMFDMVVNQKRMPPWATY